MKVKICGVTRPEDARIVEEAGASYVGAVLVPGSPRCVSPARAREVAKAVSIPLVIVIAGLDPDEAVGAAEEAGAEVIQLHGEESEGFMGELRERGGWEIWKAVRVRSGDDILAASARFEDAADLLLLDGWNPRALGGTGTPFPWGVLRDVRAELPMGLRIGVAGGLSPANVAEAVSGLGPDLVDVSSGVESSQGVKDPDRVREFVRRALEARTGVGGR